MGTQKNHLSEMVLFSTQNMCKLMGKKIFIILCSKILFILIDSKPCVKRPLSKIPKIGFQDQLSLNAILLTFIKLPFVSKIFVLSIFEWLFFTQVLLYVLNIFSGPCLCLQLMM